MSGDQHRKALKGIMLRPNGRFDVKEFRQGSQKTVAWPPEDPLR